MTPISPEDQQALSDLLDRYVARWISGGKSTLGEFWDEDEAEPYYVAEEIDAFLVGWDALQEYWTKGGGALPGLEIRTWDHRFKLVAPDVASGIFWLHWRCDMPGGGPLGGKVKATCLFRKKPDGWKFIQWSEAMLGPFPFLRRVYERAADPNFDWNAA